MTRMPILLLCLFLLAPVAGCAEMDLAVNMVDLIVGEEPEEKSEQEKYVDKQVKEFSRDLERQEAENKKRDAYNACVWQHLSEGDAVVREKCDRLNS